MSGQRNKETPNRVRSRKRGAVVAQVAISLTTLCGFAALSVDVGVMYYGRAELQRTVDAAALAAANKLGDNSEGQAEANARAAAVNFGNRNAVLGNQIGINPDQEVILGRSFMEASGKYNFTPGGQFPNAVAVEVTRTAPTYFARVFGLNSTRMSARAVAVMIPRDIVLVTDLSGSHTDDSELRQYKKTDVNLYDVWDAFPSTADLSPKTDTNGFTSSTSVVDNGDGTSRITINLTSDGDNQTAALSHVTFGLPSSAWSAAQASATTTGQYGSVEVGTDPKTGVSGIKFNATGTGLGEDGAVATDSFSFNVSNEVLSGLQMDVATKAGQGVSKVNYNMSPGPTFGTMNSFGTYQVNSSYNPVNDPGLQYLPSGSSWTSNNTLKTLLQNQGYSSTEVNYLLSSSKDGTADNWAGRVAVALGLADWKSGIPGGRWEQLGQPKGSANNNSTIDWSSEVMFNVNYPYNNSSWLEYFNYMKDTGTYLYKANSNFRYRFGVKTLMNFLMEKHPSQADTPELADAPVQPMNAVKDACQHLVDVVEELDSEDQIALVGYGNVGYGPGDKPNDLSWLTDNFGSVKAKAARLQAGMWTSNTNIAQGIDKGKAALTAEDHNARKSAAKVMILLTDGIANMKRNGSSDSSPYTQSKADAVKAATEAKALGIQIYTVSVGVDADQDLMRQIAAIGGGEHFHAEGSIGQYSAQLDSIFQKLGGKRPVLLVQ